MPEHKIVGCNPGAPHEAIEFEIASGTVAGRHHISAGRGSQDALCVLTGKDAIVGVVCDGCSSEAHSELGAILMSRMIAREFMSLTILPPCNDPATLVRVGSAGLHKSLEVIAGYLGGGKQVVYDHLLFSVVGFVISPVASYIFCGGDGLWWLEAEDGWYDGYHYQKCSNVVHVLPENGNQPLYPAYMLTHDNPQRFQLKLATAFRASLISSVGVGTDGMADLIASQDENMPGHAEKVGPLSQFWTDDKYYANPDAVRRKLWLCAQEHRRADWQGQQIVKEGAKLIDDTTLISVRRKA